MPRSAFDINAENQKVGSLCDWIDEMRALKAQFHGYVNGPADVDAEGCFVYA